jgi:hypothetical protein
VGLVDNFNRLVGLYVSVLKAVPRIKIWVPFMVYALLQAALLVLCVSYVNPLIYPILSPLVGLLGDKTAAAFGHYPGLYLFLPTVFQWAKLVLGLIFEGLAAGMTAVLFLWFFQLPRKSTLRLTYAVSKWPHLLLTWVAITALLFAVNWLLPYAFSESLRGSPRLLFAFGIALRILTVFLYSIFVYAVPSVIVHKTTFVGALGRSIRLFMSHPVFSFFLVLIPYLLSVPTSFLANRSDVIISRFSPELVFYILLVAVIADLIINFAITGAAVGFLLEEAEEGR